jgi:hypothetical protein
MNLKFDFNDITLTPEVSSKISSRFNDITLPDKLPLFTAPMDTVVDLDNMDFFEQNRINVVLPRTISKTVYFNKYYNNNHFISVGLNEIKAMIDAESILFLETNQRILIDVANGHMEIIADYCRQIKLMRPDIIIMVGNIANPETFRYYVEKQCVDFIRVGIGNGGGCLTTKNSTIGYPMASLISEINTIKQSYLELGYKHPNFKTTPKPDKIFKQKNLPYVVADGGMKDYSDIILSLALGADYVMIGSIFNKAIESCADNYLYGFKLKKNLAEKLFDKGYPIKKMFRGMSTKEAQKAMGKTNLKTSEGVVRFRKVEYHLRGWIENFEHYLRSAMSYTNKTNLTEFIGNVKYAQITTNAHARFNK